MHSHAFCDAFSNRCINIVGAIMKTKIIAALLAAVSAAVVAPAFASGYGPAPFYNPVLGAPDSQQGQNTQTLAADRANIPGNNSYGGVNSPSSDSGAYRGANTAPLQSGAWEPNTRANSVDSGH
jgi:hypothetical protein